MGQAAQAEGIRLSDPHAKLGTTQRQRELASSLDLEVEDIQRAVRGEPEPLPDPGEIWQRTLNYGFAEPLHTADPAARERARRRFIEQAEEHHPRPGPAPGPRHPPHPRGDGPSAAAGASNPKYCSPRPHSDASPAGTSHASSSHMPAGRALGEGRGGAVRDGDFGQGTCPWGAVRCGDFEAPVAVCGLVPGQEADGVDEGRHPGVRDVPGTCGRQVVGQQGHGERGHVGAPASVAGCFLRHQRMVEYRAAGRERPERVVQFGGGKRDGHKEGGLFVAGRPVLRGGVKELGDNGARVRGGDGRVLPGGGVDQVARLRQSQCGVSVQQAVTPLRPAGTEDLAQPCDGV